MAGCMGPSLLEYIPAFLSSGLLSSETATELIDFLPFIGLTIYKLQVFLKLTDPERLVNPRFLPLYHVNSTLQKIF